MLNLWSEKLLMSGGGGLAEPIRFDYTGNVQTFVVPSGLRKIKVDCVGAKGKEGYTSGGKGGRVECVLKVKPGQKLFIWIGKTPNNSRIAEYNASDIRTSNADITSNDGLNSRLVVAAGGGSGGVAVGGPASGGGNGGGLTGGASAEMYNSYSASGGTQTKGGNGAGSKDNGGYGDNGSFGLGGNGNNYDNLGWGGAGGSGWYGGGGGATRFQNLNYLSASGGGGGSSYTDPELCSEVVHTQGYQNGNGYVIISGV